ncbi:hypothetical protein GCM10025857_07130 [Alicyclobacillus contaminans]|uniref:YqaJ viral recombinase family nuclease n=1 Tax=Alicyclobacillus contaminans TaxID=392016 RepID=UPI000427DC90|nr:YqaJ viral recombinase family protein [Alicyclobacillus contaminans]GMA49356.1 hypothetical protein GCM10025857_07130 [Alicyclobacillus contaminans]
MAIADVIVNRPAPPLRDDRLTAAKVLVETQHLTHEEWLEWRRFGIGGSDAAAIAGLSPWKSPTRVFLEKIGAVIPEEAGEEAKWGARQEPLVADEFKEQTGFHVQRRNAILVHPRYPYMIANIDRLVRVPGRGWGVLEIKTTSAYKADEWEGDKVPDHYMLQMQHYLAVTALQFGYFAVLIGGQRYHQVEVERDNDLIDLLIRIEADFWRHVETKTPPPLDGYDSSTDILDCLYPAEKTDPTEVQLPEDMKMWVQQYIEACGDIKEAEERKNRAANEIKAALGDKEIGRLGDYKVSWKPVRTERFDTKAFAAAHPDLFQQFLKSSVYRRFTIS